jgi:hypothetical protein
MDTSADGDSQTQEQPIIIGQPKSETPHDDIDRPATEEPSGEQRTFRFSTEASTVRFSAGRSFTAPPLDTIDFQLEGPNSESSTHSKAEKARAALLKRAKPGRRRLQRERPAATTLATRGKQRA